MKKSFIACFAFFLLAMMVAGNQLYAQRFDRGINKSLFVPKGQWLCGGAFSYTQYGMENYQFLVLEDMKANGYTMNISPFVGYFFKDNVAAGARFGYRRTLVQLDKINLNLGEDLDFNINDFQSLQHVYYGTAMLRNYINLGQSKRFGLFNEVQLTLGGGQGKIISGRGDDLTGTYQDIYEFQLGLAPGLAAFLTDQVALEASVGVLGFNYRKVKQVKDQIYEGSFNKSSANFKIDIFSIHLGVAFYIPVKDVFTRNSKRTTLY